MGKGKGADKAAGKAAYLVLALAHARPNTLALAHARPSFPPQLTRPPSRPRPHPC